MDINCRDLAIEGGRRCIDYLLVIARHQLGIFWAVVRIRLEDELKSVFENSIGGGHFGSEAGGFAESVSRMVRTYRVWVNIDKIL